MKKIISIIIFFGINTVLIAEPYAVRKGDSLWSIADEQLNDGHLWSCLSALNRIHNPDEIHIGLNLELSGCTFNKTNNPVSKSEAPTIRVEQAAKAEYWVSRDASDSVVIQKGEYKIIQTDYLVKSINREKNQDDVRLKSGLTIDGALIKKLLPKDPRLGADQ